ncbi:TetR/AcrR family transcriptional regulator [Polyangium aurulentum]|uniref:TetR/AcrR family transcriptional regulator n=1 Tax=Polyangium aurulentum TaxID=2567896 RepID=UPI0010AEB17F|nr:TetR/AcrR family transcriptional regulator [Polyangium aurulentum]UQA55332.1 TetR/AcrR family transcriptional regulator [Polyangium aurulentum]
MSNWSVVSYVNVRELRDRLAGLVGDIDPESPKGKKRLRILQAAAELFAVQGYRKTNIDEIARASGVAKGTVYLYFANKAEVLLAVIAYEKQRSLPLIEQLFDTSIPPRARLRHWVTITIRVVASSPLLARLTEGNQELLSALSELDPAMVAQASADHREMLAGLLDEVAAPRKWSEGERRERIAVIDALPYLAPLLRNEHLRQGMSIERFAEVMASVVVDGMQPGKEGGG